MEVIKKVGTTKTSASRNELKRKYAQWSRIILCDTKADGCGARLKVTFADLLCFYHPRVPYGETEYAGVECPECGNVIRLSGKMSQQLEEYIIENRPAKYDGT